MDTEKRKDIEELLSLDGSAPDDGSEAPVRLDRVMRRVRASVGQRDSLLFAIVKFWTVIAEMVAPVFAQIAARQARASTAADTNTGIRAHSENLKTPKE
ncbi:MAG: hypothetical protein AAF265_15250 [Pseudomonadota bacterium]